MENARCPQCNRYGKRELDGFCSNCYRHSATPRQKVRKYKDLYPSVFKGAMMEVGINDIKNLSDNDCRTVMYIIERRMHVKRVNNLVREASPMESNGIEYRDDGIKDSYGLEKEVPDYERVE